MALIIGISQNRQTTVSQELENIAMPGCYAIDVYNPEELVGAVDYVFVGQVKSADGTIYENKMWLPQKDGTVKYIGDAFTKYTVHVLDNLKGELATDKDVSIKKRGGIREDGSVCDILQDDFLPEEGKTYIFTIYKQKDGTLLASGAKSNIEIKGKRGEIFNINQIKNTDIYKIYKKAVKNDKISERKKGK